MLKDAIEDTKEYKDALKAIQKELDEFKNQLEANGNMMGNCHKYWKYKKHLLLIKFGIEWKSPAECNPHIIFD